MDVVKRDLQDSIEPDLFQQKIIVLYGTRRVGKTTLSKQILEKYEQLGKKCAYFNCETITIKQKLETTNDQLLGDFLNAYELVVLDEAQSVDNIGLTLKILNDTFPNIQIIATGSSSFNLANKTGEPLVGRNRTYVLYPFSVSELSALKNTIELEAKTENILRFGLYPNVFGLPEISAKKELISIVSGYLYNDILALDNIKHSKSIVNLLQILALQIGSEVSFNEVSNKLGISVNTVIKYIDLLEKCFVIFTLPALSRNLRNEVGLKSKKIFFYDLGIRNALLNNFSNLSLRTDIGALWENFCIVELIKKAQREGREPNKYFWRTYDKKEIDYIEEEDSAMKAFEFKYNKNAKIKISEEFQTAYNTENIKIVNSQNWCKYLI